jgi:hypothetical protein
MTAIVPDSERAAATARQLRKLASWCIPALTTALTVAFFYLLSTRSPLIVRPVGLHGIPAGTIAAIAIILLAPAGVLGYAAFANRTERIAKRSQR